jgi:predicted Fe-Mo cluster-binding NifX family protein
VKICIPTENGSGIEARLCDHFGSAPYFIIVEPETGSYEVVSNNNEHHAHGQCMPMQQLSGLDLDSVVCRGMGRNALARFASGGITVFTTRSQTVSEVIEEARNGLLQPLDPSGACAGHGGVLR